MDTSVVGALGFVALFVLIALGLPIGTCMVLIGFAGLVMLGSWDAAVTTLLQKAYGMVANYTLTPVATFTVMGYIVFATGLAEDAYRAARLWLSRVPGGLAVATVAACALLGAVCGSSVAACATMSKIAVPEMKKYGYDKKLATGVVASAGPLAALIPPSILAVIYGVMTITPIGKVLMAGLIPGIIAATAFILLIVVRVILNPALAPAVDEKVSWRARFGALSSIWGIIVIFVMVMGGIYTGFFTASEAGGVGAFGALLFAIIRRTNHRKLAQSFFESVKTVGMVFLIIIGANVFTVFIARSGFSNNLAQAIATLHASPIIIFMLFGILYLFLGCFLDALGIMLLTLPIVFPIMTSLGYDPVWFGVVLIVYLEVGLLTPPVGMAVFTVKAIVTDVPLEDIYKGTFWFFVMWIAVVAILVMFPQTALWLPGIMWK